MIEITDKSKCVGCEACSQVCPQQCISMDEDDEGFLYPIVDSKLCIGCSLCEKVCPVIQHETKSKNETEIVYAVKNRDENIQYTSASGGAFSALVDWILERGGVVFGARYNERFEVEHGEGSTTEECLRFRGSKYVQSKIGSTYVRVKERLKNGDLVLFSGTPCQVAGLKLYLRREYENLYTVDIICHGVPSPKVFRDYISFVERKGELSAINMRYKGKGWLNSETLLVYKNGIQVCGDADSSLWGKLYFKHYITRPSCHCCRYVNFNREGDLTLADFWGIENKHADFYDPKGVSLLLVRAGKGEQLFNQIKTAFSVLESNTEECLQPMLYESSQPNPARDIFWRDYDKYPFEKLITNYFQDIPDNIVLRLIRKVKCLIRQMI